MSNKFQISAEFRDDQGKGASRRLRRQGRVPAILYGGGRDSKALSLDHDSLVNQLENEGFYSSILNLKVGNEDQDAILKDIQRHPAKRLIMHVDFQRVVAGEKIRVSVPLHFVNEESAPGVKLGGGTVFHNLTELEISVLPKNLPEFIEIDVGSLELNESILVSDIVLPEGAEVVSAPGDEQAVSIQRVKVAVESEEAGEETPTEEGGGDDAAEPAAE